MSYMLSSASFFEYKFQLKLIVVPRRQECAFSIPCFNSK